MYKLNVGDRCYSDIEVVDRQNLKKVDITVDPIKYKILNQDIFSLQDGIPVIEHSTIRSSPTIPAVLVLEGNRMFGRYKKRYLYKCVPDDRRMPIFLVPYKIKPGFSKKLTNKYIVFKFKNWDKKHPIGTIVQTIGDVSDLQNFYEYQLYCKSLYASIQDFTKQTMRKLKVKSEAEFIDQMIQKYSIEDRRESHEIISIDPDGSKDFDDAFSFKETDEVFILNIYIANVALWMDTLDLWSSFSQRIATIYLPDRKRPMLPTILSDALCSLQENRIRFALTLDICINKQTSEIVKYSLCNSVIRVVKNLRYDTKEQAKNPIYLRTFSFIQQLNRKYQYMDNIDTSHEFIAYIMILMNYLCAQKMRDLKIGIYRSAKYNSEVKIPKEIPTTVRKFLKNWNSTGGNYVKFENIEGHEILDLDAYVHITSPIRRLVDLLNIIQLQDVLGISKFNEKSLNFYNRWTNKEAFEYINTTMKSIRKVQNDCSLLKVCMTDNSVMKKIYLGYIFDKIVRNDGLLQYMIYLPNIGMINRITTSQQYDKYGKYDCKLYIFHDEIRLRSKIRIEII